MFDLSFAELVVIAVIAIMVVGPNELPTMLRTIGGWIRKVRKLSVELTQYLEELDTNGDIKSLQGEFRETEKFIKGDDGKVYQSFDISDVLDSSKAGTQNKAPEEKKHD